MADDIIENMQVTRVMMPDIPDSIMPTTKTFQDVLTAVENQGLELTVIEPGIPSMWVVPTFCIGTASEYDDLNNISAVLKMTYGERSFLFTGDAEKKAEDDMVASGKTFPPTCWWRDITAAAHPPARSSSIR